MSRLVKPILVVDLDGTIADHTHRVHHILGEEKDWDAFYAGILEDEVIEPIANLVGRMQKMYDILYVTGRNEKYRDVTEQWLEQEGMNHHFKLLMRSKNDRRKDHEIKPELVESYREDIELILEDRTSVVKAWREHGYTCLQVKEGDY